MWKRRPFQAAFPLPAIGIWGAPRQSARRPFVVRLEAAVVAVVTLVAHARLELVDPHPEVRELAGVDAVAGGEVQPDADRLGLPRGGRPAARDDGVGAAGAG